MEGIFNLGILLRVMDMVSGPVQKIMHQVDQLHAKAEKLQPVFDKFNDYGRWIAGAGIAGAIGLGVAVSQFANLEEAQLRLRTTLMDSAGVVGPEYERLNALADMLGTALPGSTRDMVEMFISLREQGVQTKAILGGVGEAAAQFATLMKVPFAQAATHVAKFVEALGIADTESVPFMDILQRLKDAAGVNVNDMAESIKYSGASLKALQIQGLDAGRDVSAAIGMMATSSIEGSQAGSNFAMALSRMAEISSRLETKKIAQLIGPILDAKGIKLNFFDDAGNFVGIRNMISELEKLRAVNPQEQLIILSKLFGQEASRPLSVFINQGVAGFDAMTLRMKNQADMQTKIREIMSGTKMQWETLTGTLANVVAHVGGVVARVAGLIGVMKAINALAGQLDSWILAHPKTAGIIGGVAIALTGAALAAGSLLLAVGVGGTLVTKAIVGYGMLVKALSILRLGFLATLPAIWSMTAALLANPITWIILGVVALVAGLVLLYRRFEGVRNAVSIVMYVLGYFAGAAVKLGKELWNGLQPALRALAPLFHFLAAAARKYGEMIKWAFLNMTPLGWLIKGFLSAEKYLAKLDWRKSGAQIVQTLTDGIKSMAMAPVNAVKAIFGRIRNMLPFSDAKEGPLSQLTLSGFRIMQTLGAGITGAAPGLHRTMAAALAGAALTTSVAVVPPPAGAAMKPSGPAHEAREANRRPIVINIKEIVLPNVQNGQDFTRELQRLAEGYDE